MLKKALLMTLVAFVTATNLAAQARWVMDQKRKLVGQLVGNEVLPAVIRYNLSPNDSILLEATPYELRQVVPREVIFITGGSCTDPVAYIPYAAAQLTQRQAATVSQFSVTPPTVLTMSRLYVSAPFPTPVLMPTGQVSTSRFVFGQCHNSGALGNVPVGGTYLLPLNYYQDLRATFVPPFWTP
jgi:hypothetical protein